jgi:hypothetical protein
VRYWVSIEDRLICGVCHPPAAARFVKEWLWRVRDDDGV